VEFGIFNFTFYALKRNPLTKLNIFIFLTPAFSLGMGMMFFNEKVGIWELSGMGAIFAGVFLILGRGQHESPKLVYE
jgi:drug/metabolite transporter (DMT)-like permease